MSAAVTITKTELPPARLYIYKWNGAGWNETKLLASDGAANDHFGWSVSISDDGLTALVGADLDDNSGNNSGSFYIFKWNGASWGETGRNASDGAADDHLGSSLSVSADGSIGIIGASGDDDQGSASGSAYFYSIDGALLP